MSVDAADKILSKVQRQIWIVTAGEGTDRGGLVATFVSRASIVRAMPRVLVSLAIEHNTTALVRRSGVFGAHLLSQSESDWVWRFGLDSGRHTDKLAGLRIANEATGAPILADAANWLDCRVEGCMETGDRMVFLAEVVRAGSSSEADPLTVDSLRRHAPPDKLAAMDERFARDGDIDAAHIESFRKGRG